MPEIKLVKKMGCPWYGSSSHQIECYVPEDEQARKLPGYYTHEVVYVSEAVIPEINQDSMIAFEVPTTLATYTTLWDMPESRAIVAKYPATATLPDGTKVYADISGWIIKE